MIKRLYNYILHRRLHAEGVQRALTTPEQPSQDSRPGLFRFVSLSELDKDSRRQLERVCPLDYLSVDTIRRCLPGWRQVVALAATQGIPLPAMTSALSYYDGLRAARGGANLLQAQRDYFGAHTYERVDKPRGQFFHTNWTGEGGDTAAGTYNA